MSFRDKVEAIKSKSLSAKEELKRAFAAAPDNPRIRRINSTPNCFVIPFSEMGNNWTVGYHDFVHQYKMLIKEVDNKSVDNALQFLQKALEQGYFRMSDQGRSRVNLHADVVKHIRNLIL